MAAGAYISWGLLPVYWKLLGHVPTAQLLSHRIAWSFVTLAVFLGLIGRLRPLCGRLSPEVRRCYVLASLLIGVNWFIYVWSVNAGYIVEASLGYFITPLLSVLLGVFFLRERLRGLQWAPLALAAAGVAYLAFDYGRLPWIALVLASTFSLYGLVKKRAPLPAFEGLTRINRTISLIPEEARHLSSLHPVEVMVITPSAHVLDTIALRHADRLPKSIRMFVSGAEATKRAGSGVLSYLLFESAYCQDLMQLGYTDGCERKEEMKKFFNLDESASQKPASNVVEFKRNEA